MGEPAPILSPPDLTFEPSKHVYRFGLREMPSVTAILRESELADFSAPWFSESARSRGSYVHAAIELLLEHALNLDTLDSEIRPYLDAFQRWMAESRVHVTGCEVRVCDTTLWYAGTADLLITSSDGRLLSRGLVDVKCGSVPPSVGPQTAAYVRALNDGWRDRYSLNLRNDGTYRYERLDDPDDDDDFLAALRLYHRRRTKYQTR